MAEIPRLEFKYSHELSPAQRQQIVDGEFDVMKQESMLGHAHALRDPEGLRAMIRELHFESPGQGIYAVQKGKVLGYAFFAKFPWDKKDVTIPQVKAKYEELLKDKERVRQGFTFEFLNYLFSPKTGMQVTDPTLEGQIHEQLQEHLPGLNLERHTPARLFSSYMDHPLVITHFATYNQRQGTGSKILDRARADARDMGFSHIALEDTSEASVGLTQKRDRQEAAQAQKTPHRTRSTWGHTKPRGYPFITGLSYQQSMTQAQYQEAQQEEKDFFYRMIRNLHANRNTLPASFVHTAIPLLIAKFRYLYTGQRVEPTQIDGTAIKRFLAEKS